MTLYTRSLISSPQTRPTLKDGQGGYKLLGRLDIVYYTLNVEPFSYPQQL